MSRLARLACSLPVSLHLSAAVRQLPLAPQDPTAGRAIRRRTSRSWTAPPCSSATAAANRRRRRCRCSPAIASARRADASKILFADGSTLHLDANTVVDFQSDEVVRLLDGRVRLNIAGARRERRLSRRRARRRGCRLRSLASTGIAVLRDRQRDRAGRAARRGGARQRRRQHVAPRRRARVRARRRAAVVRRTSSTRRRGTRSIAGPRARRDERLGVTAAVPAGRRAAVRRDVRPSTAPGVTSRRTATSGIRASRPAGARTTTAAGRPCGRRAGRGSDRDPWAWPTHHYGRWGFSSGLVVLDSRARAGVRPGSRGRTRRAT